MVEYSCPKCSKLFKQKGHLNNHLNRKTPCNPDNINNINKIIENIVDKVVAEKIKNLNLNNGNNNIKMKAISLFSGMGGDSLGIVNAGLELVAYSEKEKLFQKTHKLNFPNSQLIGTGDILNTTDSQLSIYYDEIELLFAGFPCQGFSIAGKKLPDDPRNTLFREFLRATRLIKPNYIIGENVKGLLTKKDTDGKLFIDIIKEEFEKLGYDIYIKVMKCNLHGIPQNRHRLIIVGIRKWLNCESTVSSDNFTQFTFPEEQENNCNIKDIIKFNMKGAVKIEPDDFDMDSIPEECMITDMENDETESEIPCMKPHPNLITLAKKRDYVYKDVAYPHRIHFGKRIPVGGEIIDIRKPLNTIICTYARQPRFFVPQKNKNGYYLRCLIPDELKQIQGFPADYKIEGDDGKQIIQIGNAVPPPLIELIINQISGNSTNLQIEIVDDEPEHNEDNNESEMEDDNELDDNELDDNDTEDYNDEPEHDDNDSDDEGNSINRGECIYNCIIDKNYFESFDAIPPNNTQARSEIHEGEITECFTCIGFNEMTYFKRQSKYYIQINNSEYDAKYIKQSIDGKKDIMENHQNFPNGLFIVQQIKGTHGHPDITLLNINETHIKIFCIEAKSGKKKIMWNDNFPRDDYYFYIFSDTHTRQTVIFPGAHETVISQTVIEEINNKIKEIREYRVDKTIRDMPNNDQKWDINPRYNFVSPHNFANVSEDIKLIWKGIFIHKINSFLN